MSRIAVVHPLSLLGRELRERLDARPLSWREVQLFSPAENEAGTLTETGGGAAVVQALNDRDPEPFDGLDVVFFCGPIESTRPWLAKVGPDVKCVVLSPGAEPEDGDPLVASLGLGESRGSRVVSPPPGAVLLAHLLAPLRSLGLVGASATLIEPASTLGEGALHELFEQAKALLTFASQPASPHLGHQWAFNLGATREENDQNLRRHLQALFGEGTGEELALEVHSLQAGVFHGMSASVALEFDAPVEAEDLQEAWRSNPAIELRTSADARADGESDDEEGEAPVDSATFGPVDAAQSEMVLLSAPRIDPNHPRRAWVWATMDNLTRGGAINALEAAEALLAS